jgi:hypothetical protein
VFEPVSNGNVGRRKLSPVPSLAEDQGIRLQSTVLKGELPMNVTLLRIAGLSGCAVFFLLSVPRVNATPAYHPSDLAPASLAAGFAQDRDRDDWDRPSDAWNDIQRRGFHDGIEGARRDAENHRQPDVNNRDEYRHPDNVPPQMRRAYREGFVADMKGACPISCVAL